MGQALTEGDVSTTSAGDPSSGGSPTRTRRSQESRRRRRRVFAPAIAIVLLAIPGASLGSSLAANTTDPLNVRVVEWARDHRLGGIVTAIEQTWYSHHQPPIGGTPRGGIPRAPKLITALHIRAPKSANHIVVPTIIAPPDIPPLVARHLPGEGVWQASGRLVNNQPALWITYLRPDPVHTSLITGVAHLDMSRLTATLHAGTSVPGGGPWVHGAHIATADYPYVVAAFNSGFRLDNSRGGYYAEGHTVQALVADRASFVTYGDGHVDVGLWGRDDMMTPGVTAVRQNLGLIIDGGTVVPGLTDANSSLWGGTVGNKIYVWRSGVGVDAHGNLVYAAGPGLNVGTLAETMRRAGCVRAMELDINTWWTSFTEYTRDSRAGLQSSNLLTTMVRRPDRYLTDGTRDFIEIDARH